MNKSGSTFLAKHLWVRAILIAFCSIAAFWVVYKILLSIFSEGGRLSEFGAVTAGLIANLWTGAVFNWLATGHFIPAPNVEALQQRQGLPTKDRFIGSPVAIILLSVAWLGTKFYVTLLNDALRAALFDSNKLGISLGEADAMKILTELSGVLSLGITFPLLAASAFIVGWACSSSLRISTMLIPSTAFCTIAAMLNYGKEVLATGHPPIYNVMRVMFGASDSRITSFDIIVMWIINVVLFIILGCFGFALYGRLWTALGFSLRRTVKGSNDLPA